MKRTIFKIERDQTKAGRTINALLGLLTANRFALIFTLRLTLVRRNYQPERMRQRAKENLLIFLILFPLAMGITIGMEKCQHPTPIVPPTEEKRDTLVNEAYSTTPLASLAPWLYPLQLPDSFAASAKL